MNEDEFGEGILRFEIYTKYICTDHFQSFLSGASEALENINSQIKSERTLGQGEVNRELIVKYQSDVGSIVHTITENSGVPFKVEFNDEAFKFVLIEPSYHFDNLPLIDTRIAPSHPEMLSLQFDTTRGINKQLIAAKEKLKNSQFEFQKETTGNANVLAFSKPYSTTRQSFEHIADAVSFVALCDKGKRENKLSIKSIANEMGMSYSTAKSKYQTGTKIIISGQIRKYFPEFRF
jgi:hypothetical protein